MAEVVSWDHLRELAAFRAEKGCAISFYVNLGLNPQGTESEVIVGGTAEGDSVC